MRHVVIASIVNGSLLVAAAASAQTQPGSGATPTPAPTYAPAPVQPPPQSPPQYQPAPADATQPPAQQQPQYGQPPPQQQPQYGQPPPQYGQAPPQQQPQYGQPPPQQQYAPPQQQPGYSQPMDVTAPPPPPPETRKLPSKAHVAIGVERVFGVQSWKQKPDTGDLESSGTMVSFLYGNSTIGDHDDGINPFAMPRFAIDGIFGGGTIGGSIGFGSLSGEDKQGGVVDTYADHTAFAIAVRGGYLLSTSDVVSLWFKAGIERYSATRDASTTETTTQILNVTLDPALVLTPIPSVGIQISPLFSFGASGSRETKSKDTGASTSADGTMQSFGVTGGLTGFI